MTTSREEALRRVRGGQGDLLYVDEAERAVSAWEASEEVHEVEVKAVAQAIARYSGGPWWLCLGRAGDAVRAARRARQEYGRTQETNDE